MNEFDTYTMQMTRDQLKQAIDQAIVIAECDDGVTLGDDEKKALRHVGETTKRVARGDYVGPKDCGCPATQAGLVNIQRNEWGVCAAEPYNGAVLRFAFSFDNVTREAARRSEVDLCRLIEVVG